MTRQRLITSFLCLSFLIAVSPAPSGQGPPGTEPALSLSKGPAGKADQELAVLPETIDGAKPSDMMTTYLLKLVRQNSES